LKIRLDQNLSFRVANAVRAALPDRAGYEVTHIDGQHPPGTTDPDWLRQFADQGGTAIVSGDYRILQHFPDLVAYTESGLISFFPPHAFEKLGRFGKVAYLVRWWPAILEKIKLSQRGDRWRLDMSWNPSHASMILLSDPRVKGGIVSKVAEGKNVVKLERKTGD
jgi:hypothetical protein